MSINCCIDDYRKVSPKITASSIPSIASNSKVLHCKVTDITNSAYFDKKSELIGVRKRTILTSETAAAIFKLRRISPGSQPSVLPIQAFSGRSVLVSRIFGISPKAVRDIWNLRTWRHVSHALVPLVGDGTQAIEQNPTIEFLAAAAASIARPIGRPRGAKDSRPRRRRVIVTTAGTTSDQLAPVPQPFAQRQPSTAATWLDCQTIAAATGFLWPRPASACRCLVDGPPSVSCPLSQPAGSSAAREENNDGPELRSTYPFFLQDCYG